MRFAWMALTVLLLLHPQIARANFIRLTIETKIEPGADASQRTLFIAVENQGDEGAYEVGLEIVATKRTTMLADALGPGKKVENRQALALEELGITGQGRFAVPLRVLYRDNNRYPFSAPSLAMVEIGAAPSRTVALLTPQGKPVTPIELSAKKETKLALRSLTGEAVTVTKIEFLTAAELPAEIHPNSFPLELTRNATLPFTLLISPVGALPGSSYPGLVIVSGEAGSMHFSEPFPIAVTVVAPPPTSSAKDYLWIVGVVVCLAAAVLLLRKMRYAQPTNAPLAP